MALGDIASPTMRDSMVARAQSKRVKTLTVKNEWMEQTLRWGLYASLLDVSRKLPCHVILCKVLVIVHSSRVN